MVKMQDEYIEQNTAGLIISYYRRRYNLSQEDVCDGICSVAALSRLESGTRDVDSLVCETLLSRIGQEVKHYEIMLDDTDYENWKVRNQLLKKIQLNSYDDFEKLQKDYRKIMDQNNPLQKQFYLYCKVRYMVQKEEDANLILTTLQEAISYTKGKDSSTHLYSKIELELALMRNIYLRSIGAQKNSETVKNLLQFYEYTECYYAKNQGKRVKCMILEELVAICKEEKNYEKAMQYLNQLIQVTRDQKSLFPLGDYFFQKAKLAEQLCCEKEECAEACRIAYHIYLFFEESEKMDEVRKYCEEKLGCPIIIQEW